MALLYKKDGLGATCLYRTVTNFLVLGNDVLLSNDNKARFHDADTHELSSHVAQGNWENARNVAKRLKGADKMLLILDIEKGDFDSAYIDYNKNLPHQYPKVYPADIQATIYESFGDRLMADGKIDKAKDFYQKAVEGFQKQLLKIQNIESSNKNFSKYYTSEEMKKKEKAFAVSLDQQNSNVERVQQKIETIEDQK
jgi:tetratricopeptide (TPR) repeat protein